MKKIVSYLLDEVVIKLSEENQSLREEIKQLKANKSEGLSEVLSKVPYHKVKNRESDILKGALLDRLTDMEKMIDQMTSNHMNLAKKNTELQVQMEITQSHYMDLEQERKFKEYQLHMVGPNTNPVFQDI